MSVEFDPPVSDIVFSLDAMARATAAGDWDCDLARQIIEAFAQFARERIAPLNSIGDRQGCQLQQGRVIMPQGFAEVYQEYLEQGWPSMSVPLAFGGQQLAAPVLGAISELFTGANHSLQMVTGLVPGAVRTLCNFASTEQQQRWIPQLASGEALATMCLTEPQAGSDLSGVRTRALKTERGWTIDGEKIFISGGDQNLSQRILHLVLARSGERDEGTRGLSLFLVGSERADGSRNAISVGRIEHKMGLHASPTCHLVFSQAEAELIGEPGRGLQAMFTMMNHARLDVALQGVAHSARASDIAHRYAAERIQGGRAIADHPPIRQLLDEMRALTLGCRALCQYALFALDTGEQSALLDFLTPLCKILCSEAGIYVANQSIQILGGYGYLSEYACEQIFRDVRITAIYEGSNQIHAGSLATRLLKVDNGAAAEAFYRFVKAGSVDAALDSGIENWNNWRQRLAASDDIGAQAWAFAQLSAVLAYQRAWQLLLEYGQGNAQTNDLTSLYQRSLHSGFMRASAAQAEQEVLCNFS